MAYWADSIVARIEAQLDEVQRVLRLSVKGIWKLSRSANLIKAVSEYEKHQNPQADAAQTAQRVERAEEEERLARSEVGNGFPVLHAQATVALWGALEAFVDDLVVGALLVDPAALQDRRIGKIKVSIAEFQARDPVDRMRLLARELARQSNADLSDGITRFEVILDFVRLSGEVDPPTRQALFELSQVRNAIVHRSSIVDRKLALACPWLGLAVGSRHSVKPEKYLEYSAAVSNYVAAVLHRLIALRAASQAEAERPIPKED